MGDRATVVGQPKLHRDAEILSVPVNVNGDVLRGVNNTPCRKIGEGDHSTFYECSDKAGTVTMSHDNITSGDVLNLYILSFAGDTQTLYFHRPVDPDSDLVRTSHPTNPYVTFTPVVAAIESQNLIASN